MTIAASWVRKVNNCEELCFASDSRLCGGHRWDECPKLVVMPDNNSVLSFAGDTNYAYPMMMQIKHAMQGYTRIETRAMDITDICGHIINHANHLMKSVYDEADIDYIPDLEFLYGGYSWVEKKFRLWRFYVKSLSKKRPVTYEMVKEKAQSVILPNISGNIKIIGDRKEDFKKELRSIIINKYKEDFNQYGQCINKSNKKSLDMEPFQALCNLLSKTTKEPTIGGAPQMIKSYQYMNARPVGVYWPEKSDDDFQNRTLLGRRLFDYEDTIYWFIDPASLRVNPCLKNKSNGELDLKFDTQ